MCNQIEEKIRSLGVPEKLISIIETGIEKALKEKNNFWWGCIIGVSYNSRIDIIRVEKGEEYETDNNNFKPIVKVKYLSPYDEKVKSRIVKWYSLGNGFMSNLKKDAGAVDADHIKTVTDKLLITNSGVKCKNIITGKSVTAYHIDKAGAAHNKGNTKCIGCIGVDLIPL